ncbi:MAG: DUF4160 domain-containing protein [Vitreimonas sp.]
MCLEAPRFVRGGVLWRALRRRARILRIRSRRSAFWSGHGRRCARPASTLGLELCNHCTYAERDASAGAVFQHGDRDVLRRSQPPHFHVLGRDGAAQVAIETLEVIAVSGRVDLREALKWAAEHKDVISAKWHELSGT